MGHFPIALIGEQAELRYDYEYLGAGADTLAAVASGKNAFRDVLAKAERPLIIIGQGALTGENGAAVLASAAKLAQDVGAINAEWNGFSVLHTAASRVGALDLGVVPGEGGKAARDMLGNLDVVFLLGADELDMTTKGSSFVVYIGTHGDAGAHAADVILPGAAYTEKSGTWLNTEGRVQLGNRAGFAPGEAKEDWAILRALSDTLGKRLPFDSLAQLRAKLYADFPHMMAIDTIAPASADDIVGLAAKASNLSGGAAFVSPVKDFYLTNPIARASAVMAECSALAAGSFQQAAE
jgi:NADH-quinone oxidoreductase subunit G